MQNDELGDKIVNMAQDLMNTSEVDTVQVIITYYDPINGKTQELYTGLGNFYARKGILESILENDLEFVTQGDDEFEEEEETFGDTD